MAHCIYLEDSEFDLFKKKEVGVSHCPNSNFWYVHVISSPGPSWLEIFILFWGRGYVTVVI